MTNNIKGKSRKYFILTLIECLLIIAIVLLVLFIEPNSIFKPAKDINIDISILSYNDDKVELAIISDTPVKECAITTDENSNKNNLLFTNTINNSCIIDGILQNYYVFFKDNDDNISQGLLVANYLLRNDFKDNYYLAIGGSESIKENILYFGDKEIKYEIENEDIVKLEDDIIYGLVEGNTKLKVYVGDELYKESNIYVTKGITVMPSKFDNKKPFLPCKRYDSEEAKMMDEILYDRINSAGYATRAGVVAAGRFLTLEFPYRLKYFYENGRIHESGVNFVDGEGRYYHRGLYINEDKFDILLASSVAGPSIWGCKLTNFEDDPPLYERFAKLPNGLDCSGFVSWVILNGGFDVGDIGAGETPYPHQLTDTGEYTELTNELINSDIIKPGDLFSMYGHISILLGMDDTNFYIAESLNTYDGLVLKTYNKKTVNKVFTHIVLMDSVYKEDGNLTNMW